MFTMIMCLFICSQRVGFMAVSISDSRLNELLKSMGEGANFLNNTSPLNEEDFSLIGKFIQMYCSADYRGRHLVNQMRQINGSGDRGFGNKLTEEQVLMHLSLQSDKLEGFQNIKEGLIKAVEILKLHRLRRHELSHWMFRRVKDNDVYICLTTNGVEASRRGVDGVLDDCVGFGLIPVEDLKEEMRKLRGHIDYFVEVSVFFTRHIESVKKNR